MRSQAQSKWEAFLKICTVVLNLRLSKLDLYILICYIMTAEPFSSASARADSSSYYFLEATAMNNGARTPSVVIDVVGNRVREARKAVGLTQEELGAQAKLSRITVSRIERGERKQLKPAALQSIALATQKPEAYFYAVKSPNETLEDVIERSNMSRRLAVLLPRVTELPLMQQEKLGGIIEELLDWHDSGKAS